EGSCAATPFTRAASTRSLDYLNTDGEKVIARCGTLARRSGGVGVPRAEAAEASPEPGAPGGRDRAGSERGGSESAAFRSRFTGRRFPEYARAGRGKGRGEDGHRQPGPPRDLHEQGRGDLLARPSPAH